MSKHTPGPWHVSSNTAQDLVCAGDEVVADCTTGDLPDISIANARLIAAAPELLEACKSLLPEGWDDGVMDHMPGVKIARLAIAKAEGR